MPAKLVKLHVPAGTDEVNFGEKAYRVDNDGTVMVPPEAVADLMAKAACTLEPPLPERDEGEPGKVRVRHADEGASCSWGGQSFEADKDGTVLVPAGAVAELASHGFEAV